MEPEEFPITQYTVQLYYHPAGEAFEENVPFQIASGVLIRKYKKHFLLTCKHVFDHIIPSDVIIFTPSLFVVRLSAQVAFVNNIADNIDLALVELRSSPSYVKKLLFLFALP